MIILSSLNCPGVNVWIFFFCLLVSFSMICQCTEYNVDLNRINSSENVCLAFHASPLLIHFVYKHWEGIPFYKRKYSYHFWNVILMIFFSYYTQRKRRQLVLLIQLRSHVKLISSVVGSATVATMVLLIYLTL